MTADTFTFHEAMEIIGRKDRLLEAKDERIAKLEAQVEWLTRHSVCVTSHYSPKFD